MRELLKFLVCFLAGIGAGLGTGFAGMSAAAVISPIGYIDDKENGKRLTHCPFRLRETKSPCIVTDAWKNTEIDTRVVHTVQFKDQAISFDPTATYIIHGRRFACKKIELKITDRGLSPLKTGYFYEIKD